MMTHVHLQPCRACARHIRASEGACPFCGAPTTEAFRATAPAPLPFVRMGRAALLAWGAVAVSGCADEQSPQPALAPSPGPPPAVLTPIAEPPAPTPPPPAPPPPVEPLAEVVAEEADEADERPAMRRRRRRRPVPPPDVPVPLYGGPGF